MKKVLLGVLLSMLSLPALGQVSALTGFCEKGATSALVSGLPSTNALQGVVPYCTGTVYVTGTTTLATIYSTSTRTPISGSTFTATSSGQWLFYAATTSCYDVVLSGGILPNVISPAVTMTGMCGGGGGGGGGVVAANYGQAFANATTVTLLASATQLGTANGLIECYDTAGNAIIPSSKNINQTNNNGTVTFAIPQSGYCALNGSGGGGGGGVVAVNYGQAFANATTVTLLASATQLGTANGLIECYDTAGNAIIPSSKNINQTNNNGTVTFAIPQSGYCALNGGGGGLAGTITATGVSGGFAVPKTLTAGTYGYAPITTQYLITAGDSTTAGYLTPTPTSQSWPAQLSQLPFFLNRATLVNEAVSGSDCQDMSTRYPTTVKPYKPNGTTITKAYLAVMIGRNNIGVVTDSQLSACISNYISVAVGDGFTVTPMTMLPSATTATPFPGFTGTTWDSISYSQEVSRQNVNTYIRLTYGTATAPNSNGGYVTPAFDTAQMIGNPYDATITYDGTHPLPGVYAKIASNMNTFFQQGTAVANALPVDGYSPIVHGLAQFGDQYAGDLLAGGNCVTKNFPGLPGVNLCWNFNGNQEGDLVAIPLTGSAAGFTLLQEDYNGANRRLLATFNTAGSTLPAVVKAGDATNGGDLIGGANFGYTPSAGNPGVHIGFNLSNSLQEGDLIAVPLSGVGIGMNFYSENSDGTNTQTLASLSPLNGGLTGGRVNTKVFNSTNAAPATATSACIAGDFYDGVLAGIAYHFYCYATNTWARVAMTNGGW